MTRILDRWRLGMVAGAICLAAGGRLHPSFDTSRPTFDLIVASPLFSRAWAPDHALILAGLILVTLGLAGLVPSGLHSGPGLLAARAAVVGGALSAIEMTFHLFAFVERDAAVAGRPTPVIAIHQALQVPSHPIFGFAVAALAIIEIGRLGSSKLGWAWRIASVIGLLGAIAHGLAGPVVILTRDAKLGGLFAGAGPMAAYLGVYALLAPRFQNDTRSKLTTCAGAIDPALPRV